jgi:hypothetical protein
VQGTPIISSASASPVFTTKEGTTVDLLNPVSDFSTASPTARSIGPTDQRRRIFLKFKTPFTIPAGDTGVFVFKDCNFLATATYINIDTVGMKVTTTFAINPVSSFGSLTMATLNWNTQGSVSLLGTSFVTNGPHIRRASLGGTYSSASGTPILRDGSVSPDFQRDALVIPYPAGSAVTMVGIRLTITLAADLSARVSSALADFTIPRDFSTLWVSGFYYYLDSKFPPRP